MTKLFQSAVEGIAFALALGAAVWLATSIGGCGSAETKARGCAAWRVAHEVAHEVADRMCDGEEEVTDAR